MKAIAIIGGGLKNDNSRWRTTYFNEEGDDFGALGDRLRVLAGGLLYEENPQSLIIALGGKGQLKDIPDAQAVSAVIKNELVELGIPAENIIIENQSGNTFEQLRELQKIILDNNFEDISVISNRYHLPRIKAMIELDEKFREKLEGGRVEILSAEEILIKYSPDEWKENIEAAYNSEAMKKRISLEANGVKEIKEGVYKYN